MTVDELKSTFNVDDHSLGKYLFAIPYDCLFLPITKSDPDLLFYLAKSQISKCVGDLKFMYFIQTNMQCKIYS